MRLLNTKRSARVVFFFELYDNLQYELLVAVDDVEEVEFDIDIEDVIETVELAVLLVLDTLCELELARDDVVLAVLFIVEVVKVKVLVKLEVEFCDMVFVLLVVAEEEVIDKVLEADEGIKLEVVVAEPVAALALFLEVIIALLVLVDVELELIVLVEVLEVAIELVVLEEIDVPGKAELVVEVVGGIELPKLFIVVEEVDEIEEILMVLVVD